MGQVNPFMHIGDDPTSPLDLSAVSIESQYTKLSESEKLLVFYKLKGIDRKICDIETFINDDYFLGQITQGGKGVYKYWHQELAKLYPSPAINKYPYVSLGGAIGIGKSTFSRIAALYNHHKFDCFINPWRSCGLMPGKPIVFMFSHVASQDVVQREFIQWLSENKKKSPYFQNLYHNPDISYISSSMRDQNSLGSDLAFAVLSEVNFTPNTDKIIDKINTAVVRYAARFQANRHLIGGIWVDSSASPISEVNPQSVFEKELVERDELFISKASHWEVKDFDYKESGGKTFPVYLGDSKTFPFIMAEGQKLRDDQDPSRIMNVPVQLRVKFQSDIRKAISDLGGKNISASNLFFDGNISNLLKCSSIQNLIPDTIRVDFYNKNQNLYDQIEPMLRGIPREVCLHLHYDIGITSDFTGASIVYFSEYRSEDGLTKEPVYVCPMTVSIDRIAGQQTSIWHLYQLASFIAKARNNNIIVSADTFQSRQLLQDLERDGIPVRTISSDKTDQPANYFKNVVNRGMITIPYNQRLLRECSDLEITPKGKIDHPQKASTVYDNLDGKKPGSKDVFDSLCNALWSCHLSISENMENGYNSGYTRQLEVINGMTKDSREEAGKEIQNMIENIW